MEIRNGIEMIIFTLFLKYLCIINELKVINYEISI